jgi:hypothetical protein
MEKGLHTGKPEKPQSDLKIFKKKEVPSSCSTNTLKSNSTVSKH